MPKKIKQVTPEQNEMMLKVIEGDSQKKKYQAVIYDEASVTPEQNEMMLKVIEGEPTWQELIQGLVPIMYASAAMETGVRIMHDSLKEAGVIK